MAQQDTKVEESSATPPTDTSSRSNSLDGEVVKRTWSQSLIKELKTWGSALQIVVAAIIAITIGIAVTTNVDNVPEAAPAILEIPGSLWLRALRATGTSRTVYSIAF